MALLLVCAAACGGYFLGYQRGLDRGLVLQNGTFVGTFDALQKLRAGDLDSGTRRIETLCFSAANTVFSGRAASQSVARPSVDEFRSYRHSYRSNRAEWTVAEQNLEAKLVNWKRELNPITYCILRRPRAA